QPWTIKITSIKNGDVILQQGMQNEMPLLGRGTVGLYSTDVNVSFKDFGIKLNGKGTVSKDKLKLPPLFKDGMVLQREVNFPVWGVAEPFKFVFITIDNQTVKCISDSLGNWRANFSPLRASERVNFIIESEDTEIRLSDVAVGEVWLAS